MVGKITHHPSVCSEPSLRIHNKKKGISKRKKKKMERKRWGPFIGNNEGEGLCTGFESAGLGVIPDIGNQISSQQGSNQQNLEIRKMWEAGKRMGFHSYASNLAVADFIEKLNGANKGLGDNNTVLQ